ncbi:hypothetical protein ScPMuIL_000036 [Solemya velum]
MLSSIVWIVLSRVSVNGDLQACLQQAERLCAQLHNDHPTVYCATNGHTYNGSCILRKAICTEKYVNHHSLRLNATGNHCQHHVGGQTSTTTQRSLTQAEVALYGDITNEIDDRLASSRAKNITPEEALPIFSKQDHAHQSYVRNTKCWAYSLDLTSISPWNSHNGNRKAGTLVSPRHIIFARHYSIRLNSTIRFVDRNNRVVDRRLVKTKPLPNPPGTHGREWLGQSDLVVGLLETDVPSSITFAKVLPKNLTLIQPPTNVHVPVLSTDFEEKALVADFYSLSRYRGILRTPAGTSSRSDYFEPKIVGDSGNPSFFVIHDDLVLLFVFTFGGAGSGSSIVYHYDEINLLMSQLGGGYQLTDVDLSAFIGTHAPSQVILG